MGFTKIEGCTFRREDQLVKDSDNLSKQLFDEHMVVCFGDALTPDLRSALLLAYMEGADCVSDTKTMDGVKRVCACIPLRPLFPPGTTTSTAASAQWAQQPGAGEFL